MFWHTVMWLWVIPGVATFVSHLNPHHGEGLYLFTSIVARLGKGSVHVYRLRWWL